MNKYSKAVAYLNAMGLSDRLDSFANRKRIQKTVYLLKQFGADLPFGYTWYLHGPYSPDLTRTLFTQLELKTDEVPHLERADFERINRVRNFLADDLYSVDSLELIVSLIYLIKHAPDEGYNTRQKIVRFLQEKKPQFSSEQIDVAWTKISEAGIWNQYLADLSTSQ